MVNADTVTINVLGGSFVQATSDAVFALHGPTGVEYSAECKVLSVRNLSNSEVSASVECFSGPASGEPHTWIVVSAHERTAATNPQLTTTFRSPSIVSVETDVPELHTGGKNLLTLLGLNFGALGDEAMVSYGDSHGAYLQISEFLFCLLRSIRSTLVRHVV